MAGYKLPEYHDIDRNVLAQNAWHILMDETPNAPKNGPYNHDSISDLKHAYKRLGVGGLQRGGHSPSQQINPTQFATTDDIQTAFARADESITRALAEEGAETTALKAQRTALIEARDFLLGDGKTQGANAQIEAMLGNATQLAAQEMPSLRNNQDIYKAWKTVENGGKKSIEFPIIGLKAEDSHDLIYNVKRAFSHPDFTVSVVNENGFPFLRVSHISGTMPLTGEQIMQCLEEGNTINEMWARAGGKALTAATEAAKSGLATIDHAKVKQSAWNHLIEGLDGKNKSSLSRAYRVVNDHGSGITMERVRDAYQGLGLPLTEWATPQAIAEAYSQKGGEKNITATTAKNFLETQIRGGITVNDKVGRMLESDTAQLIGQLENRFAHGFTAWRTSEPFGFYHPHHLDTHGFSIISDYSTYSNKPYVSYAIGQMPEAEKATFVKRIEELARTSDLATHTYHDPMGLEIIRVEGRTVGKEFSLIEEGSKVTATVEEMAHAVPHLLQHPGTTLTAALTAVKQTLGAASAATATAHAATPLAAATHEAAAAVAAPYRDLRHLAAIDKGCLERNVWENLLQGTEDSAKGRGTHLQTLHYIATDRTAASIDMGQIKQAYDDLDIIKGCPATETEITEALSRQLAKGGNIATNAQKARDLLLNPVSAVGEDSRAATTTLNDMATRLHTTTASALQTKLTDLYRSGFTVSHIVTDLEEKPSFEYSTAHMSQKASKQFTDLIHEHFAGLDVEISHHALSDGDMVIRVTGNQVGAFVDKSGALVGDATRLTRAIPFLLDGKTLSKALEDSKINATAVALAPQHNTASHAPTELHSGGYSVGSGESAGETASKVVKEAEGGKLGMIALGVGAAAITGYALLELLRRHERGSEPHTSTGKS